MLEWIEPSKQKTTVISTNVVSCCILISTNPHISVTISFFSPFGLRWRHRKVKEVNVDIENQGLYNGFKNLTFFSTTVDWKLRKNLFLRGKPLIDSQDFFLFFPPVRRSLRPAISRMHSERTGCLMNCHIGHINMLVMKSSLDQFFFVFLLWAKLIFLGFESLLSLIFFLLPNPPP